MTTPGQPGAWAEAGPRPGGPARGGSPAGPAPAGSAAGARRTRKARLVLARVDPWSVMKLGFLLSIALAIVSIVAVLVLWLVLDALGVFDAVNRTVSDVTSSETSAGVDVLAYVGLGKVLGVTTVLACVNVVLFTALATLGAFLYNIAATLVGGLHVTLAEES
ncbi:MAG: DUF3566 domain-containing protein [Motilibacteraceae bacterium]